MNKSIPHNIKYAKKFRNLLININRDLFLVREKMEELKKSASYYNDEDEEQYDELHYLVMALEDRRFLEHCGVDWRSVIRELKNWLMGKKHGGASTIDMQMVRTITGFKDRTVYRKIYEACLAFIVNFKFSKKEIIDCYLNNAFFGSHIYGINSAIQKCYEKKYIADLNLDEKAQLAAMLQIPRPLNPSEKWVEKILERASYAQFVWRSMKNSND